MAFVLAKVVYLSFGFCYGVFKEGWKVKLGNLVGVLGLVAAMTLPLTAISAEKAADKTAATPVAKANVELVKLNPYQLLENVTDKVVGIARREGDKIKESPEKYHEEFAVILDDAIDFPFIAKAVMGKNYYPSATKKQRDDFAQAFKRDLIKTYTGALAIYADREFKVLPASEAPPETGRLSIVQQVSGPDGKIEVAYTMGRKTTSQPWKMINFTLPDQGVNLGAAARTQFDRAMAANKGDLDAVIANWGK